MEKKDEGLIRTIGVFGLSANIINIIIGSGIFVLPAIIAGIMGASSIFAYLFCGILIALITLCFAEAGSKVTNTGGPYTYIETAFGDYAGFIAGVFAVVSAILSDAAVSNALVNILATVNPLFGTGWIRLCFMFIIFSGLAYINILGIKQGIGLVKLNTVIKLVPLLLLIIFGWKEVSTINLHIESFPNLKELGATSLILFFAFCGVESGLIVGGEVTNPKRTVPRAILISITTVVVLYILIQTVSQGVLGKGLVNFKAAPLAETAKVVFGPVGFIVLVVGASISMFGFLSGEILNVPRVLYALARDKVIPINALTKIHKKYTTPYIAIIVYALCGFIIAATASFEQLVVIATSSILILYFGVALSVIKLRRTHKTEEKEFKIPGGWTVPVLSMCIILYFLSNLSKNEMIGTAIFIGVLTVIFYLIQFFKKKVNDKTLPRHP